MTIPRHNLLTTFECIFRVSTFDSPAKLLEESPAVGDMRCLWDAAAAMGTENKDRTRDEDARLKVEANTLAACAGLACRSRSCCGRAGVGRVG